MNRIFIFLLVLFLTPLFASFEDSVSDTTEVENDILELDKQINELKLKEFSRALVVHKKIDEAAFYISKEVSLTSVAREKQ